MTSVIHFLRASFPLLLSIIAFLICTPRAAWAQGVEDGPESDHQIKPVVEASSLQETQAEDGVLLEVLAGDLGDIVNSSIKFGGNGTQIAFSREASGEWSVNVGKGQYGPYAGLYEPGIVLSASGNRSMFIVPLEGGQAIVLDGQTSQAFSQVAVPCFVGPNEVAAYQARIGSEWFQVIEGERIGPFEGLANGTQPVAYGAEFQDTYFIAFDGEKWIIPGLSGRGKSFLPRETNPATGEPCFLEKKDAGWTINYGGVEKGLWIGVSQMVYSADGNNLAFVGTPADAGSDGEVVVVGEKQFTGFDSVAEIAFGPAGGNHFILGKGTERVSPASKGGNEGRAPRLEVRAKGKKFLVNGEKQELAAEMAFEPFFDAAGRVIFHSTANRIMWGEKEISFRDGELLLKPEVGFDGRSIHFVVERAEQEGARFFVFENSEKKHAFPYYSASVISNDRTGEETSIPGVVAIDDPEAFSVTSIHEIKAGRPGMVFLARIQPSLSFAKKRGGDMKFTSIGFMVPSEQDAILLDGKVIYSGKAISDAKLCGDGEWISAVVEDGLGTAIVAIPLLDGAIKRVAIDGYHPGMVINTEDSSVIHCVAVKDGHFVRVSMTLKG